MLSNSREDELLHKLKNCIGTLQNSNAHFQMSKVVPNNYSTLKENYQQPIMNPPKNMSIITNAKNSTLNSYQLPERQPLAPSNHSVLTSYHPTNNTSFQAPNHKIQIPANQTQLYQQARQSMKKWQQPKVYQATPRKYEYQGKKMERQERYKGLDLEDRIKNKQQQVRGQISRRYSLMQHQKSNNKYTESSNTVKIVPTRNYQQQVEERKELLQSALERRQRTPTNAKKEYVAPTIGSIRKQINYTSRDPPKPTPSQIIFSSRKPQKPMIIKQNLQRAYQQQQKQNQSECSALAKLRKISELNQKINDRIRNIINVFEQHKC